MNWKLGTLFIVCLGAISCSKFESAKTHRWHSSQSSEPQITMAQQVFINHSLHGAKPISLGKKTILRQPQTVKGFLVEGTWIQKVKVGERLNSLNFHYFENVPESVLQQAEFIEANKSHYVALAKHQCAQYQAGGETLEQQVILKPPSPQRTWESFFNIKYIPVGETEIFNCYIAISGKVKSLTKIDHSFADGEAYVFSTHAVDSKITSKVLRNLKGTGELGSRRIIIESELLPVPFEPSNVFSYDPKSAKFDMVQAYFFIDKTLNWFNENWSLQLPYTMNVKLHLGGASPTNAAFFYGGKIRLGQGDGIHYKDIPRDPTIVHHEANHAFVEYLSGMSFEGEPGSFSEAFADFFTALQLKQPHMGKYSFLKADFKRTIDNSRRADKDLNGKKYNDSLVISGTFWEIQEKLGTDVAANLAKEFLVEMGPGATFSEFARVLRVVAQESLTSSQQKMVESILSGRGWNAL